jgi:hypothetical protein
MVIARGICVVALCGTVTGGCVPHEGGRSTPVQSATSTGDGTVKVGLWSVGCNINERDPYGTRVSADYCSVMGGNYKDEFDNALSMTAETILVVDAEGGRLQEQRKVSRSCNDIPKRVAVDGVRIDTLPREKQVDAVLHGAVLI